jgi:hypothetical protein
MPAYAESVSRRDWQQIFVLLDTALELDSSQHRAWLDALPPEQARLSPMLNSLLRAHADVGTGDSTARSATFSPATRNWRHPACRSRLSDCIACCARSARRYGERLVSPTGLTAS